MSPRLGLVRDLPPEVQERVRAGRVVPHVAMNYLLPLARANAADCLTLLAHLGAERPSSRAMGRLYVSYMAGDARTRERLVADPLLFLRVDEERRRQPADTGGQLLADLRALLAITRRLRRHLEQWRGEALSAEVHAQADVLISEAQGLRRRLVPRLAPPANAVAFAGPPTLAISSIAHVGWARNVRNSATLPRLRDAERVRFMFSSPQAEAAGFTAPESAAVGGIHASSDHHRAGGPASAGQHRRRGRARGHLHALRQRHLPRVQELQVLRALREARRHVLGLQVRQDMTTPIVRWQNYYAGDAAPPADALEWVTIAREIGPDPPTVVRFVRLERGRWTVAEASRSRIHIGPRSWDAGLIHMEDALKAALRAAGKPVAD